MQNRRERRLGWRGMVLVLVGILAGSFLVAPAVAHVGSWDHNWRQHIRPRADERYLRQSRTYVAFDQLPGGAGQQSTTVVNCPAGFEALGGGVHFQSNYPDVVVTWNGPMIEGDNIVAADPGRNGAATGWKVEVENTVGAAWDYAVGVICSRAA